MSKFKVGDKVVRKQLYRGDNWCKRNPDCPGDSVHTVSATQLGSSWIELDNKPYYWDADLFDLVSAPGLPEELPAPKASDAVNSPKHYQFFPDLEAIEVIAHSMTQEQFYGYCLGNRLKYRLRAGNKDKLEQDIAKSDKYSELYEQHRGKCIDTK
ncbi:nucleotide kinase [Klebsiella phage VLC4]|uniref:Nucleotide kinase n=3 Tax=Drulisvirus TaxID=1920774 RepID=A0A6B9I9J3_9CAUD|nr:nucleotide kinase [Klebsiella phage VLC1]QGZ00802.1 nucleotide kinase [Klebsiella phage VLC2]QGZ00920.1 nucleotide kinase [Klebsiella phage VLC4]UEW68096.1 nucleotide kinase [Klebsiella phage vB_KpnM-VAC25]UVX28976.1 nucleotide kinase [Klebsiella phage VLCpiA1p]UVX29068.1 nucleotide kinase [Klebsiella phage VLCpiA1r]UVX29135.1 nucleotide kinase [Klebsiella phage VLCpiA1q]